MESHGGSYSTFPNEPEVPARIHAVLPHARFIYIVRDPIERAISRYIHQYSNNVEHRAVDEALLDANDPEYVPQSLYFMQLERYLRYFEPSRFLIVSHQDLLHARRPTLRSIFRFLGVRDDLWRPEFDAVLHASAQKRRNTALGMLLHRAIGERIFRRLHDGQRYWFKKLLYTPFSTPIPRPSLAEATRRKLRDLFRGDVAKLEEFAGRRFPGWLD
jgi:hypothetical protein